MKRNCNFCEQEYHAEARYVNRGQGLFCSRECSGKHRSQILSAKRIANSTCAYCDKEFYRLPSKANKTKLVFCSKECQNDAARDPNSAYTSGPVSTGIPTKCKFCDICKKPHWARKSLTCVSCRKNKTIEQWLAGNNEITLNKGKSRETKPFVKKYLLETRGDACEICGFKEHGPYGSIIQMDHIDGNCHNNNPSNLKLLCPNHHAMTSTYGSRNKGSGRAHRRKS